MKRIKSFKVFNRVESRLRVFESFDDTLDIVSNIKDMLLELDFLDIDSKYAFVPGLWGNDEAIVIKLSKVAVKKEDYSFKPSYTWDDVKDVIEPVMEYLESEGFMWHKDKGTLAYNGVPIISTSGSYQFDNIKSKIEMVFIR